MTNKKRLRKNLKRFSNNTEQPLKFYSGALGIYIGGRQYVDVPNRPGFVYVRLRNNISELIQAHNQLVSPVYDLPVLVVRGQNYYEIYSRDTQQYTSYWETQSSFLPRHGFQHEFDPANNGGGDLVFVHGEQFFPLMGFPSGTDGAGNILIAPYRYYYNGYWRYAGNTGTGDLLQYRPTGSSGARLILVGTTADTGNPFVKTGNEFSANVTGSAELTTYVPTNVNFQTEMPNTIIRLVTGTSSITWANMYDAKQYYGLQAGSTGLFAGSFLDLSDSPDSYSGQGNKVVSVKSNQTGLEFITPVTDFLALTDTPNSYSGAGSKFVAVKSTADGLEFVNSPGGGGGSGVVIFDDGIYKVTGSVIDFGTGLDVVVTGTTAFVSAPAGGTPAIVKLTSIELSSSADHISFTGVAQSYETLQFIGRVLAADANISSLGFILNGISGSVYSTLRAEANNNAWGFTTSASGTSVVISNRVRDAAASTTFGSLSFDMLIPEIIKTPIYIVITS